MKITKSTSLWQNSGADIGEKANFGVVERITNLLQKIISFLVNHYL